MLPEIIMSSPTGGLVYIGDAFLGELQQNNYLSFIGAGSFFLRFIPMSTEKIYAPITAKITVADGVPHFDCRYMSCFNYKDGVFLLELQPSCLAAHSLPVCLSYKKLEDRFTVSLIEQNTCYLVIEDDRRQLPDGFFPVSADKRPVIDILSMKSRSLVLVCDNSSHLYVFMRNSRGFYQSLFLEADSYSAADDALVIKKTTSFGHTVTNTYTLKNDVLTLAHSGYTVSPQPAEDIITDFLECVKFGIETKALSYLSPDLSLTFPELREFMGEFSELRRSPFDDNAFALINKRDGSSNLVNRFTFEIIGGRINNIQEL